MPAFFARVIWIFGQPGSGKTAVCRALGNFLRLQGTPALVLDEEELQATLSLNERSTGQGRSDDLPRAAELAKMLATQGPAVIVARSAAKESHRQQVRDIIGENLLMVQLDCPRNEREARSSSKEKGQLPEDEDADPPSSDVLNLPTGELPVSECVQRIHRFVRERAERGPRENGPQDRSLRRILPNGQQELPASEPEPEKVPAFRARTSTEAKSAVPWEPWKRSAANRTEKAEPAKADAEDNTPPAEEPPDISTDEAPPPPRKTSPVPRLPEPVQGANDTAPETGEPKVPSVQVRKRRFVETQDFLASPRIVIGVTLAISIASAWVAWLVNSSMKKRDANERLLAGELTNAHTGAKDEPSTTQADASATRDRRPKIPSISTVLATPGNGGKPVEKFMPSQPPADAAAITRQAIAEVEDYFSGTNWRDRLPHIRDAQRCTPLMESYYAEVGKPEKAPGMLQTSAFLRSGSTEVLRLSYAAGAGDARDDINLVRQPDNKWKIDWESHSGAGDMTWVELMLRRPTSPTLLRVNAKPSTRYAGSFNDPDKYLATAFEEPRGRGNVIHGYCERNSAQAEMLRQLLKSEKALPLTVRVAYPEFSRVTDCVRVVEVVAEGWLLP